mmetsp:Transcript_10733/g.23901  ORF Transcript_10733/g.23901 Transcript_10733/m.23901 type:complete len:290 (+) Transcript_10733:913-1782(+)
MMASFAPTRVKMRSTGVSRQDDALTQQPKCAMSVVRHACRRIVDLPPMLGPVTSSMRGSSSSPSSSFPMSMSFGMQSAPGRLACTHVLTPCRISRKGVCCSTNTGRHMPGDEETRAKETRQSSSAAQLTARFHRAKNFANRPKSRFAPCASACSSLSFASRYTPTCSRMSSSQNLLHPFFCDMRVNSSGVPLRFRVSSETTNWKGSVVEPAGIQYSIDRSPKCFCHSRRISSSRAVAASRSLFAASWSSSAPSLGTTRPSDLAACQSNVPRRLASSASIAGKPSPFVNA